MTRSYRSRYDVIASILEAAVGGAKKTRIMHWADVNYQSFKRYFPVLLDDGLIVKVEDPDGGEMYRTTEEGRIVLKTFTSVLGRFNGGPSHFKYNKLPEPLVNYPDA